ncbi:hypothetical protein OBV_01650 [Oscillibacter valericigenes Sjm18-20]|nr:hypothetical protein OBV_01650 [Oscillibacter valericigenes Sjm18-20]
MGKVMILRRGLDTSDATATAADILPDKTAYVDGVKLLGASTAKHIAIQEIVCTTQNDLTFSDFIGKTNFVVLAAPYSIYNHYLSFYGSGITGLYINGTTVHALYSEVSGTQIRFTDAVPYEPYTIFTFNSATGNIHIQSNGGLYFPIGMPFRGYAW